MNRDPLGDALEPQSSVLLKGIELINFSPFARSGFCAFP
jgi:hypothetical protein